MKWTLALFALGLAGVLLWAGAIYIWADVKALRQVVAYTPPKSSQVREVGLAMDQQLTLHQIPAELLFATFAAEDYEFPVHHGVRIGNTLKCLKERILKGVRCGGSSLSQQVVKNVFVGAKYSYYRKFKEMIYAIKLERYFSKAEIFTLYINLAETGPGVYGYQAGASLYFNKLAKDLSPVECAFLVSNLSLPQERPSWFLYGHPDALQEQFMGYVLFNTMVYVQELFGQGRAPQDFLQSDPFPFLASQHAKVARAWPRYSQNHRLQKEVAQKVRDFMLERIQELQEKKLSS